ncbi:LamG-like jellyroll fold domain-containing protein [Flexithrix dorotheae]|uniref:LamG-like jellyroll fold domain-containing protein n=1 Tax=Flexithrix dorotheae TaxID=70993 RepID=UPI00036AA65B|nr:LamG-like jellyroll fold domain-containing protein [Flexithrix dorotheae]
MSITQISLSGIFSFLFTSILYGQSVDLERGLIARYSLNETLIEEVHQENITNHDAELLEAIRCGDDAYYFDGYKNYIDCGTPKAFDQIEEGLTISTWVYIMPKNKLGLSLIAGRWAFNKDQDQFGLFIGGKNTVAFSVGDGYTLEEGIFAKNRLEYNTWYHIVGMWKPSGDMAIFINGKFNNTGKQKGYGINTESKVSFKIGRQVEGADRPFKGYIDEVQVFNRTLSNKEVEALFNREFELCNQFTLQGQVVNAKTGDIMTSDVIIEDLDTGEEIITVSTDNEFQEYLVGLAVGKRYAIYPRKEGFLPIYSNFDATNIERDLVVHKDLKLVPFEVGETVRLNNIFFDTGKATLRETSFHELNKLVKLFKHAPNLKIQVAGHTDDVGTDASNVALSEARAKSVKDYLLSHTISSDKVDSKGYGESEPVASNETEEGKQFNRRVEFVILSK